MEAVDKFLAHYGVKGMKWGVRRSRSRGTPPELQTASAQKKHEVLGTIRKHGIDAVTNDDLKMLEQRVKLEMKYNELFPKKKTVADHGLEIAKRVLQPIAEQAAKDYLKKQVNARVLGPGVPVKTGEKPSSVANVLDLVGDHQAPKTKVKIGFV